MSSQPPPQPLAAQTVYTALAGAERIGIDTEFHRENTYFAALCLVQVATPSETLLVDPLTEENLQSLWKRLASCEWVVHAGRQDIEVLYQQSPRMPQALFDTQIAAGLLGFPPQLGYAGLVMELFDVKLAKTQTRADWRRRPLSQAMLTYACDDVKYLLEAAAVLQDRLVAAGRDGWAREDSAALLDPKLYENDPRVAIERIKGAGSLKEVPRRAAAALATWREQRALARNRPRQWILKDALLLDIARRGPKSVAELAATDGLPPAVVRRHATEIVEVLRQAPAIAIDAPPAAPSEREKAALKALQKRVAECAEELGVAAEILAPRRELAAAVRGLRDGRVFGGWRRAVIGEQLLSMLD